MASFTVVYDACLLYPASIRDLVVELGRTGLLSAKWTERIHSEWISAVLRQRPELVRSRLERVAELMNAAVDDCLVSGFESLEAGLTGLPDPNDRHVLAAAIHSPRAHRSRTTNGVRSRVLSSATRSGRRGLTQTRSSPEYPGRFTRIEADFAGWMNKPLSDLNTWLIESWRKGQSEDGKKPKTINRDVQRLQALLSKAVDWGVLDRHPFHGLKPLKTDRTGRVRYLSAEEEASLRGALSRRDEILRQARIRFNEWRAARHRRALPLRGEPYADHLHPVVLVAMNTGLRRSELFHLRWEDVDLDARWLTVHGTTAKNGQTRRIPLNAEAQSTLQAWRRLAKEGETRVFPGVGGERLKRVDRAWRGLRKRAELQNFRFHDLRHHFASRLVQSGVPLNTVRELLGHADTTMVLRYAHLSPDHLAEAVEKIAHPRGASVAPVILRDRASEVSTRSSR
ncbi:MAG: tyrosine-type recombinase/integrase [Gallionella sp.]|nr:tyrosine-type recombinase/integrase [Gallionella sp.]